MEATATSPLTTARAPLSSRTIFVRYVIFAVIAGVANIGSQDIALRILAGYPLMLSVLIGTAIGFLVKYLLEKKWVFLDTYDNHAAELRKIIVYGAFGVGTTLLFWAFEFAAWHIWQTDLARTLGAALGLALGNWIKYLLDKQYVFGRRAA